MKNWSPRWRPRNKASFPNEPAWGGAPEAVGTASAIDQAKQSRFAGRSPGDARPEFHTAKPLRGREFDNSTEGGDAVLGAWNLVLASGNETSPAVP